MDNINTIHIGFSFSTRSPIAGSLGATSTALLSLPRNIASDYVHKLGNRILELADEHGLTMVFENLSKLRNRVNGSSSFNKKLSLWFYKRIQFTIGYETLERRLEIISASIPYL
ncbi:MAG: IS200/IS605 family accessory protein TnpB-related protein [Ignisphaera sp.]